MPQGDERQSSVNPYYYDLALQDYEKGRCRDPANVSKALMHSTWETLGRLQDFLTNSLVSIEKGQELACVRWKKVLSKGPRYNLNEKNAWVELKWHDAYRLLGWPKEKGRIGDDTVGIRINPYHVNIESLEIPGCFLPLDESSEELLRGLIQSKKPVVIVENEEYILEKMEQNLGIDSLHIEGHKCKIIKKIAIKDGIRLLVSPVPKISNSIAKIDGIAGTVELKKEKAIQSGTFSDNDGKEFKLNLIDGNLIPENGADIDGKTLTNKEGVEFVATLSERGKNGFIISLEEVEGGTELAKDPRYSFFEQDVKEIWLKKRVSFKDNDNKIAIIRGDSEQMQLVLKRYPPEDAKYFFLPINTNNIRNQLKAILALSAMPLSHHRGLIRLFEDPERSDWPREGIPANISDDEWCYLDKTEVDGTEAEREFVRMALATPDFAFLEGPPGSGKTTTIAELVYQLACRGKKVLVVSNTHYAIDNLLEKLKANARALKVTSPIRVSNNVDKVGDQVEEFHLSSLCEEMASRQCFKGNLNMDDLKNLVLSSAMVVCATTTGIGAHPDMAIKDIELDRQMRSHFKSGEPNARPIFDYLIIDESSKSTLQEFIFPAVFAKKWILVGDIMQLPPYAETKEIEGAVRLLDTFPSSHQSSLLSLFDIDRTRERIGAPHFLMIADDSFVEAYLNEEILRNNDREKDLDKRPAKVIFVINDHKIIEDGPEWITCVNPQDLRMNPSIACKMAMADVVLVSPTKYDKIQHLLPPDLIIIKGKAVQEHLYRHNYWLGEDNNERSLSRSFRLDRTKIHSYRELETFLQVHGQMKDWAAEWVWRVRRLGELNNVSSKQVTSYEEAIVQLQPRYKSDNISNDLALIKNLYFPSTLESLQRGVKLVGSEGRLRNSWITQGMGDIFKKRHVKLEYQHRMEPCLSKMPSKLFYNDEALKNSNILEGRTKDVGYTFDKDGPYGKFHWIDIEGSVREGKNREEVDAVIQVLNDFSAWAKDNPRRKKHGSSIEPGLWSVAVLTFFLGQESLLAERLASWSQDSRNRKTRFYKGNLEIVVGTIDRFQGREADLVLLSLRNTDRLGFMDSLNRINVAMTRARFQMIIIGKKSLFLYGSDDVPQWGELARYKCEEM